MKTHQELSEQILNAIETNETCKPIVAQLQNKTIEDAYKVQQLVTQKRMENGLKIIGRKIGLTSFAVQKQLGVNQPDFGTLLDGTLYENASEIEFNSLIQPKAEAEIAVILNKNLTSNNLTFDEVFNAIEYALPALEIVDSRIEDWKISIYDTIADNASSGVFVLGKDKILPENVNWTDCKMNMTCNSETVSEGKGSDCLDNPINGLLWLAKIMVEQNTPLQKGEIILTGALGPMHTLQKGDHIKAEIETVGSVEVRF